VPVARFICALAVSLCGCQALEPEVAVCNLLGDPVQVTDISFQECFWPVILSPDECTSPCACHPGSGRARFRRFDVQWFVNEIIDSAEEGILELDPADDRIGWKLPAPIWHTYMTSENFTVDYGDFRRIDLLGGGIEQDFEAPGPHGH